MRSTFCPECGLHAPCTTCGKPRLAVVEPPVFVPHAGSPEVTTLVTMTPDQIGNVIREAVAMGQEASRAEVYRLRALIKDAEWDARRGRDDDACCPWCQTYDNESHLDICPAFTPEGNVR